MWIDVLPPLIYCMAGWLGSCIMFKRGPFYNHYSHSPNTQSQPLAHQPRSDETSVLNQAVFSADREHAITEATERLRTFAKSLAANVDAHQTEVQAVSDSLQKSTEGISNESLCIAVNRLIEANETMQYQLRSSQDQIQDQANRLETAERIAQTDALTRVCNRRAFDGHLASRVALGPGKAGTLMLLDIDNFKRFNDTYGHRTGDEVLRVVAGVLNGRLNEYGMVARYGGEEFAVILDGYSVRDSIPIVEAARKAIGNQEVLFENKRLHVTASIGLAEFGPNESSNDWVQHADDCLYLSKNNGRNCGHWSDAGEYFPITSGECPVDQVAGVSVPISLPITPVAKEQASTITVAAELKPADVATPPSVNEPVVVTKLGETKSTDVVQPVPVEVDSVAEKNLQDSASDPLKPPVSQDHSRSETKADAPALSNPFPYLPDRDTLAISARELGEHLKTTRMPMAIMAIQLSERLKGPASRSLLQIVRAASRTIDQIGCNGPTTLLICMPNTNAAAALGRAEQIVRSVATLNLGVQATDSTNFIGVAVCQWDGSPDFHSAFDTVQELALASTLEMSNPIRSAVIVASS